MSILGREMGLTAQDLNRLLKEHGFLEGDPGAYRVTPKGEPFAHETDKLQGDPRSLTYSAQWTTRRWDGSIINVLKDEMAARRAGKAEDEAQPAHDAATDNSGADDGATHDYGHDEQQRPSADSWKAIAVGVTVTVVGVVAANPRVHQWVRESVQPRAISLWRKVRRIDPPPVTALDAGTGHVLEAAEADRHDGAAEPNGLPAAD